MTLSKRGGRTAGARPKNDLGLTGYIKKRGRTVGCQADDLSFALRLERSEGVERKATGPMTRPKKNVGVSGR